MSGNPAFAHTAAMVATADLFGLAVFPAYVARRLGADDGARHRWGSMPASRPAAMSRFGTPAVQPASQARLRGLATLPVRDGLGNWSDHGAKP